MIEKNFNFFFNPVSKVKGIGPKIKKLFGMLNSQFSAMDTELGVKK